MIDCKYINYYKLYDAFLEIFKDYLDDEYYKYESLTEEYTDILTQNTCESMNKYVHMKDTSIYGNFNDIREDYNREHDNNFDEMIEKIDKNQLEDEELEEFQDWTESWFFETFGTYNIKYNFSYFIDEIEQNDVEEQ